ncbi:hypothetical protein MHPYR_180103 [uncultured Mycobacterium sp.]|uniref:Uncharacterized protein n=1 Tax=uncultured Mycobacterium sp. TaxID=171292 RepID=A0A1Y5P977_9MYCO|nr:hypothetical protein MHPYR_180103 [uncultured Mycobacterium sp.]
MNEPILTSITTLLDITDDLIGVVVSKGAGEDRTPHDFEDLRMARLLIESAGALVQAADNENRAGIAERLKR